MNEQLVAEGSFCLRKYSADGSLIFCYEDKNLVVLGGKTNISKLLAGAADGKPITQVAVGTNGTAPAAGDTALTNEFKKALGSPTYPDTQTVQFNGEILGTEVPGMTIREYGLYTQSNVLFARKVREGDTLNSGEKFIINWKIKIV